MQLRELKQESSLNSFIGIVAGVLLACPPYIHIFLDSEIDAPIFGYDNPMIFWLDIGQALSLTFISVILLLKVLYPDNRPIHQFAKHSVFSFLITGVLFSLKPFITTTDFTKTTYYVSLLVASIAIAVGILWSIKSFQRLRKQKFSEIFNFLVVKTWSAEKGIIHKALMAGFKSGMKKEIAFEDFEKDQDIWEEELDELIQKYGKG